MRGSPMKWHVLNLPPLGRLLESPFSLPTLAAALGKFVSSQTPRVAAFFDFQKSEPTPLSEQIAERSIQT